MTFLFTLPLKAQVNIGSDTNPNPFSILELTTKISPGGLRMPQLDNKERVAVQEKFNENTATAEAAKGLVIYNTDSGCLEFWNGTEWISLCADTASPAACVTPAQPSEINGNKFVKKGAKETYSVDNVEGVTYKWTVPDGWTINSGDNTNSITATASIDAGYGTVTVTPSNNCGDIGITRTLNVSFSCGAYNLDGEWVDFMCYNLGAGADAAINPFSYVEGNADGSGGTLGYLYQWGRISDGHQLRNSETAEGPETNLDDNGQVAGDNIGKFIDSNNDIGDWRDPGDSYLWYDDGKTVNDPCPDGWHVASAEDWHNIFGGIYNTGMDITTAEVNTWKFINSGNGGGLLITPSNSSKPTLFLPAAGYRTDDSGMDDGDYSGGQYWTCSPRGGIGSGRTTNSCAMRFWESNGNTSIRIQSTLGTPRSQGYSVRCIADE